MVILRQLSHKIIFHAIYWFHYISCFNVRACPGLSSWAVEKETHCVKTGVFLCSQFLLTIQAHGHIIAGLIDCEM